MYAVRFREINANDHAYKVSGLDIQMPVYTDCLLLWIGTESGEENGWELKGLSTGVNLSSVLSLLKIDVKVYKGTRCQTKPIKAKSHMIVTI